MRTILGGLRWGEGPRASSHAMFLSDPHSKALWIGESGAWSVHELASPSNGLGLLPDGTLVAALMDEVTIGRWDGSAFRPYADLRDIAQGPLGDLIVDADGGLYVDDVGYAPHRGEPARPGRLAYVAPGGSAVRIAAEGLDFPNGLALIDGGRTLVVAETWRQQLVAFDVAGQGKLTARRVYADLRDHGGTGDIGAGAGLRLAPDGICAAREGGVWAATLTGQRIVRAYDGRIRASVDTTPEHPVAVCVDPAGKLYATLASTGGAELMDAVARRTVSTRLAEISAP